MNLAVIEGKWFRGSNTSIRGMFDLLSDIHFDNPHKYHYEMFNDATAFREIFMRLSASDGIHNIYVAGHGEENAISGSNAKPISKTIIRNTIIDASNKDGRLDSVYFGCCSFGNVKILEQLLQAGDRLRWVAGYDQPVDFIDSSSFDWLFWNYYQRAEGTALVRIRTTVSELQRDVPGLINRLGFRVGAWDGKFKQLL